MCHYSIYAKMPAVYLMEEIIFHYMSSKFAIFEFPSILLCDETWKTLDNRKKYTNIFSSYYVFI